MKEVLVVAVHPDDETLGAGGTLLRHKNEGDNIHWMIITNAFIDQGYSEEMVSKRQIEIEKVRNKYGFSTINKLDFPTTQLEEFSKGDLISKVSSVFNEIKPSVVYLQYPGDAHSEHKFTFENVYSCTKSFRYPFVKEVYAMETLSETEFGQPFQHNIFNPNYFVDITGYLDQKLEIMNIYESEMGEHPFPRSERNIRALATMRGAFAGTEFAEAFMCLKYIR